MRTTLPFVIFFALPLSLLGASCGDDGGGGTGGSGGSGTGTASGSSGTATGTASGTATGTTTGTATGTATGSSTGGSTGTATGGSSTGGTTGGTTGGMVPPCPYTPVGGMVDVGVEKIADGFTRPVFALGHPTEPDRLFVVEQAGTIKVLEPGAAVAPMEAFLDIRSQVDDGPNEAGLLGLAFHPNFPQDPRFYVDYITSGGGKPRRTRISEFALDVGDPNLADPTTERIILELEQPAGNHNGGMIAFGPDGYLYIGTGDGGGGCDDAGNSSRDTDVLLAKMLRIGVEPDNSPDNPLACASCQALGPFDYTIPEDNPFVDDASFAPEIYAWGLRNPWRFAFDLDGGALFAGDVGQDRAEEIDLIEAGRDYGWVRMEGNLCSSDTNCGGAACAPAAAPNQANADGFVAPLIQILHSQSSVCAITGGAVYRSCEVPAWDGLYLYSDFCDRALRGLTWDGNSVNDVGPVGLKIPGNVSGNGWNAWGDVYFTTFDGGGPQGSVYRVVPQ